jgi:hypothetical protein
MGGEREDVIEATPKKKRKEATGTVEVESGSSAENVVQTIRIHESGGEVHFHDDKNHLKAAVPGALMFEQWMRLEDPTSPTADFFHVDRKNNSVLIIQVAYDRNLDTNEVIKEMEISLYPFVDGGTNEVYDKFQKFMTP